MLQGCTIHIHININIGQALRLSRVIGLRFERAQSLGLRSIVTSAVVFFDLDPITRYDVTSKNQTLPILLEKKCLDSKSNERLLAVSYVCITPLCTVRNREWTRRRMLEINSDTVESVPIVGDNKKASHFIR